MHEPLTLKGIEDKLEAHFKEDINFQENMAKQFARMEPMFAAFEEKKITSMVFDKKTNTLYLYSKKVLTIGGAIGLIYTFLKVIVPKILH